MEGEQPIGHVSISLAEPNSMKVYFSNGITESMDGSQKDKWYGFLKELRMFAKRRLLSFDTRDIAKDNLDKRDYAFLSQYSQPKPTTNTAVQTPVGESIMSESNLYGTKTVSYQKLENTRLIIKHSQALADDMAPGARSRNIAGLFVENQDGERFKYPFIHLSGARAMQRHVANGGKPYDEIGESIIRMSEEIAQLKSFGNYVVRNDLMNSDTNNVVERSSEQLNKLRETIAKLAKQGHYEAYRESFQAQSPMEVPQDVVEQFTDQFTVKNFKEDIASVFPVLYRLMQTENTLGYDDIVAMTQQDELANEDVEIDTYEDPFARFEDWAMGLGEESAIQSSDPEEQKAALQQLQELVGQHFSAGVDGSNAIESLKGIIEDPQLDQAIKAQAKEDPDSCTRGLVKDWLEQNAPEALEQLDFGDYVEEPADAEQGMEQPEGEELPQEASDANHPEYDKQDDYDLSPAQRGKGSDKYRLPDPKKHDDRHERDFRKRSSNEEAVDKVEKDKDGNVKSWSHEGDWEKSQGKDPRGKVTHASDLARRKSEKMNTKELAEFINSFYDRDSGTFPKGPEGVCVMVGKKFGEQAEHVARQFVERMAPQQTTEQNPELAELSRIKELVQY
jgi:hypothetical protein